MIQVNVTPRQDQRPHTHAPCCRCAPRLDSEGRLVVHNAFDGREFWEDLKLAAIPPLTVNFGWSVYVREVY